MSAIQAKTTKTSTFRKIVRITLLSVGTMVFIIGIAAIAQGIHGGERVLLSGSALMITSNFWRR